MKHKIITALSVIALFFSGGCSDWLNVQPESLIDGDDLFTTEDGYKKALTGVYGLMAQTDLYGRRMSFDIPEALSQHWTVSSVTSSSSSNLIAIYYLNRYDYTYSSVETLIKDAWIAFYKPIAQVNDILTTMEKNPLSFTHNNGKLIRGEALGLRAFLHLDVLRLWGPIPSEDKNVTAIPYVLEMTTAVDELLSLSYEEVINHIIKDLDEAERLLLQYDPIVKYSNTVLNDRANVGDDAPDDEWQFLRQGRFNYYAVLGTKARLYQWLGNKGEAMKYAKMVIDALNEDDSPKFGLADGNYMSGKDRNYVFYKEHLFGVHNSSHVSLVKSYFIDGTPPLLSNAKLSMDNVFPESIESDIRYTHFGLWQNVEYEAGLLSICNKYIGSSLAGMNSLNRIPLLRLAEMYLIMIEDLPFDEVRPYLTTYIESRGITSTVIDRSLTSEDELDKQLVKEYRKEFFAEGQMFYFYKRRATQTFTWPSETKISLNNYVVPKPQGQVKFE